MVSVGIAHSCAILNSDLDDNERYKDQADNRGMIRSGSNYDWIKEKIMSLNL
jgi:hypothetical protein